MLRLALLQDRLPDTSPAPKTLADVSILANRTVRYHQAILFTGVYTQRYQKLKIFVKKPEERN